MMTIPQRSLSWKFLGKVFPFLLLISCIFSVVVMYQEVKSQNAMQYYFFQTQADNIAMIVSQPLWQFEEAIVQTSLDTFMANEGVVCIKVQAREENVSRPLAAGQCDDVAQKGVTFSSPVVFSSMNTDNYIADIQLTASISVAWQNILKNTFFIIMLVVSLFAVLAYVTLKEFKKIILVPLQHVADSIKHFKNTGQRELVDWYSDDELGRFITEYNASLTREIESEQSAIEASATAEQALSHLEHTHKELIQAEKLASLGALVAGVSHEINTPVGNGVIVTSSMLDKIQKFKQKLVSGQMKKSTLESFLEQIDEASHILSRNLQKTADLVEHFKQVAADQTSARRRVFDLHEVIEDNIYTMRPKFKHTAHQILNEVPEGLMLDSYPGALGQIVTNVINNALLHAFDENSPGILTITAEAIDNEQLRISMQDNGKGMHAEQVEKAFTPYFTTKLGQGGTGLGLSLVKTMTETELGGQVTIHSKSSQGLNITLVIPKRPEKEV